MECFENDSSCPGPSSIKSDECFSRVNSSCPGEVLSSRYDDASATWVIICAILMFFMKAGFLFLEEAFSKNDSRYRRRVVLAKYIDIFGGTLGFWLFGYAVSGNTDASILGEQQDFIFWFFRFTFASNTATILGGTLVGQNVQMRTTSIFVYSFLMTAAIHPYLARLFWSVLPGTWSPYATCNGTFIANREHSFVSLKEEPSQFIFIDFAGSGLVHLCGGMGGLVLSFFHKLETKKSVRRLRECFGCCKGCLVRNPLNTEMAAPGNAGAEEAEVAQVFLPHMRAQNPCSSLMKRFIEWMYPSGGGDENVEFAALGILILWTTWFAFNAGSTENIAGKNDHSAVGRIALVMCVACASAGIVQVMLSGLVQVYKRDTTFNTNEIANVVLGSLVAVTGCAPFIEPHFAALIGVLTVFIYHLGCFIEFMIGIYDGARVFPVHAMCGFWGVLCVGIFSRSCLIRELYGSLCFCLESTLPSTIEERGLLFGYQLAGAVIIMLWSLVLCSIIFLSLWFLPVKAILTCLPWLCSFNDEERGEINFTGNVLFTHFDEIGTPHFENYAINTAGRQMEQAETTA